MASNLQKNLSIVDEIFYNQYFKTKITKIEEEVKQRSKKKRHGMLTYFELTEMATYVNPDWK